MQKHIVVFASAVHMLKLEEHSVKKNPTICNKTIPPEVTMRCEISQSPKDKCHMFPLIYIKKSLSVKYKM